MPMQVADYLSLNKEIDSIYGRKKDEMQKVEEANIRQLFGYVKTDKLYHTHQLLDKQGKVGLVGDGEEYGNTKMSEGFNKTFKMMKVGENVVVTEDTIAYDRYNVIYDQVENIMDVLYSSMYEYMADFLNNAWSTKFVAPYYDDMTADASCPDGQPLISATHTVKSVPDYVADNRLLTKSGGTNPELNYENLTHNYNKARKFRDSDGTLAPRSFKTLVVGPDLASLAETLINTDKVIGSNNNDINTMKNRLKVLVIPQLKETKWFLAGTKVTESLKLFMKTDPEKTNPPAPETKDIKTGNLTWNFKARFQCGLGNGLFIFGSKGDNS